MTNAPHALMEFSASSKFLQPRLLGRQGHLGNLFLTQTLRPNVVNKRLVKIRGIRVESYTRKPQRRRGANLLVDGNTGNCFVVWGRVYAESTVPLLNVSTGATANDVHLGVECGDDNANEGFEIVSRSKSVESSTTSSNVSNPSLERLKAHRVKALLRKTSQKNRESTKVGGIDDAKNSASDDSVNLQSNKHHSMVEKKKESAFRNKERVPRVRELQESMPLMGPEASDLEDSANNFSGWGNGMPIQISKFESIDLQMQRKKLSSGRDFFSQISFEEMGCSEYMAESLRKQLFLRPSHIQAKAFIPVVEGNTCIIADQSGSGKTLAYLLPIIQRLRQEELQGHSKSSSHSPRVIIMTPTAELASQVLRNCRSLSKSGVPFRSMAVTGGFHQRTQLENLQEGVDVLIGTPGRLMLLIKEGFLQLSELKCTVLDEVDILFNDDGFEAVFLSVINSSPVTAQYLFVTATLPVEIYNKLIENFPDCKLIMGPGIHRTSPGLEEVLVDCSGDEGSEKTPESAFLNKKGALLQLVDRSPVSKTIVFCNKIETCRRVENALKRFDKKGNHVEVLPFHAALAKDIRIANLQEFTKSGNDEVSQFLVCTDRASRGIDFSNVDHVVLFDFPRDPSEYVRRVGRTARGAGGRGKAFIFVVGKQVSLARRIIERNRKGHPLHRVPSAYEVENL